MGYNHDYVRMKASLLFTSFCLITSALFPALRAEASSDTVQFTAAILRFTGEVPEAFFNEDREPGTVVINESIDKLAKTTRSLPGGEVIANMRLRSVLGKDVHSKTGQYLVKNEIGWAPVDKVPESADDDSTFFIGNDLKVNVTAENDSIYFVDIDFNHYELEGFVEFENGSMFPTVQTLSSKSNLKVRPNVTFVIGYSSAVSTTEPETSEPEEVFTFFLCSVKPD